MYVGLFGGSFNPPHLGHLIMAEMAREYCALDEIWWMPAYRPPHKHDRALAAPHHRLALTQHAVAGNDAFVVSDQELRRQGTSYTADTLRSLHADHPGTAFSLLLGGDSLRGFSTWYRPDEILALAELIVYPRGHVAPAEAPDLPPHTRLPDVPLLAVSSTDIRARVQAGRSIRYLVPESVRAYIAAHGLYRE